MLTALCGVWFVAVPLRSGVPVLPCFGTGDDETGDDWLELFRVVGTDWSGELLRLVQRWCRAGKTTGEKVEEDGGSKL